MPKRGKRTIPKCHKCGAFCLASTEDGNYPAHYPKDWPKSTILCIASFTHPPEELEPPKPETVKRFIPQWFEDYLYNQIPRVDIASEKQWRNEDG